MRDARSSVRRITLLMLFVTVLLNAILFLAPLSEPAGTVDIGEEGGANIVDEERQFRDMNGFARAVYLFGDATCHQKASRSLFVNGNQMPVCARDVGIYLGLTAGTVIFMVFPRRFSFWWLAVVIAPLGFDGMVQLLTSYESNNVLRLATGSLYGMIIAVFILQLMNEIYDTRLRLFGPERWLRERFDMPERPRDRYSYGTRERRRPMDGPRGPARRSGSSTDHRRRRRVSRGRPRDGNDGTEERDVSRR